LPLRPATFADPCQSPDPSPIPFCPSPSHLPTPAFTGFIANAGIAADGLGKVHALGAGKVAGVLGVGKAIGDHYLNSFALLNDIIKTVNSIHIAATNVGVGAAAAGVNALVDKLE
jgi:hypothetical protein